MANVTTIEDDIPIGESLHLYSGTISISSYTNGGEPLDPGGNSKLKRLQTGAGGGYVTSFDPATQKIKVFRQKDPAAAGGADIALPEVANGVDLSSIPFGFLAIGS